MATAAGGANESDVELAPAVMDTEAPIQATNDAELTMLIVTPKKNFYKVKVVYVQCPMQETTPSGNDELVA